MYVGHREKYQGLTIKDTGEVFVHLLSGDHVRADSFFYETSYERESGKPKVRNRVPGMFSPHLNAHLLTFHGICAIDTNTKTIRGEQISVSCLVEAYPKRISDEQMSLDYRVHGVMVFKNAAQPERFAWSKVVGMITGVPQYSDSVKIAMITDHDLGNHAAYMARELPIHGDTYLPPTVTLIYSSTDGVKEEVTNFLLALADKQAGDVLRALEETGRATFGGRTISIESVEEPR